MKKTCVLLIITIMFVFTGCVLDGNSELPSEESTTVDLNIQDSNVSSNSQNDTVNMDDANTTDSNGVFSYYENWESNGLEQIGLKKTKLVHKECGIFSLNSSHKEHAYLFFDFDVYGDEIYHNSYLAVEVGDYVYIKDLNAISGSYGDKITVCDINGDGINEILLQQTVAMSGGEGQFFSRVFSIHNNMIVETYSSISDSDERYYNTGFASEFIDGYKLKIYNEFTEDSWMIDLSNTKDVYAGVYGENATVIRQDEIVCDTFKEFYPIDFDEDGIDEIYCEQYVWLLSHSNHIGYAMTILKFDASMNDFKIIQTDFKAMTVIPKTVDGSMS